MHAEAARLFEEVISRPNGAFADRALVGLTRLLVDPEYAGRTMRRRTSWRSASSARAPDSAYAAEARAWRISSASYLTRSQELAQLARELDESTRSWSAARRRSSGSSTWTRSSSSAPRS